jgi:hypothetical protein
MLQSAFVKSAIASRSSALLIRNYQAIIPIILLFLAGLTVNAQDTTVKQPETTAKKEEPKKEKKSNNQKEALKNLTAEQVVESTIIIYAYPGGREKMAQIRKTEVERGKLTSTNAAGQATNANYLRFVQRGEPGKTKFRLDQEQPTATFALVQNDDKVFGIYNDSVFQPRADAIATFQDRLSHSIDSLLWYKESGSKIELAGREKILGVDFHLIDLTDSKGGKTRYYVSAKTFRVMMLDYETGGVKHTRKFRDYKYAQGVLVPFSSELTVGDKVIEEIRVGTVTFGQKLDETLFASAS